METASHGSHWVKLGCGAALLLTIWAANWAIQEFGVVSIPFGLTAPAGVYFAGLAFGLRDVLHEVGGGKWVVAAILAGTALSYVLSDGAEIPGGMVSIAAASAAAFLLSEFADFAVYTPLRERHWTAAAVGSNLIGTVVDSAVFLWLAFGSLGFIEGQIVGKMLMVLPVLPVLYWARRRVCGPAD